MAEHLAPGRPPFPCHRERWGACRLCDLLDRQGPHYREDYRRAYFPEEFAHEPPRPCSKAPAYQWPEQGQPPSVAESLRLLAEMKACPHRTPLSSCNCSGTCSLGKGANGVVSHRDCFACLGG